MQFFIPGASAEQAEKAYEAIRSFVHHTLGRTVTARRVFRISFREGGYDHVAQVGQVFGKVNEMVVAILEGDPFLVCTPSRGIQGLPVLVGREDIREIEDFEPTPEASEG